MGLSRNRELQQAMGKLLEFPSQQAQGLAFLDRQLRQMLTARGADEALVDFAAEQLTRTYARVKEGERYDFSLELPGDLTGEQRAVIEEQLGAGLEELRQRNHALVLELVAQLVLAEVKLFQQQRD